MIALLQAQAENWNQQTQKIEALQTRIDNYERFHRQIGLLYQNSPFNTDSELPTTSANDLLNF